MSTNDSFKVTGLCCFDVFCHSDVEGSAGFADIKRTAGTLQKVYNAHGGARDFVSGVPFFAVRKGYINACVKELAVVTVSTRCN